MPETISRIPVSSDSLRKKPNQQLNHLPGPAGHWLLGNLRRLGQDPQPELSALRQKHGDCFTFGFFRNQRAVVLVGPEANELVLLDRENNFSSYWGWEIIQTFFGRNVLVRDFEDHRLHRKLMTRLFKPDALARYLQEMRAPIKDAVDGLDGCIDVYQHTKVLALDIAIRVFAGISADEIAEWNADLSTVLANVMSHRIRLPGTRYWRGLAARDRLRARLVDEIQVRRGRPGDDLFSQLVNSVDERGQVLSENDVVDHMFGLLFAAHDTTASSLAMMFRILAERPDVQDRARQECLELRKRSASGELRYEDLAQLSYLEAAFSETLRMYAPIQFLPRRSVREFCFQGNTIPANTWILLAPQVAHFDSDHFPQPEVFDPGRFESGEVAPFSYIPFGKGSHMCLGLHFARMEIKAVLYQVLVTRRLTLGSTVEPDLEYLPVVRPRNDMSVEFSRCDRADDEEVDLA